METTGFWAGETRNRRKDGTPFYSYARVSVLETAGKKCWIAVQEDITERRQVEAALRQSEASYRVVTEGSLAGVYVIQDDKFRYVNPVLAQAFGYTPDELIDRLGPSDLVAPEDRDRISGNVERRLAGEGLPSRSYFKGLCQDGSVIHVKTLSRQVEYTGARRSWAPCWTSPKDSWPRRLSRPGGKIPDDFRRRQRRHRGDRAGDRRFPGGQPEIPGDGRIRCKGSRDA